MKNELAPVGKREGEILFRGQHAEDIDVKTSAGTYRLFGGDSVTDTEKSRLALALYGVFSGVIFSLLMDGFSVLWAEGTFSLSRYGAFVVAALPVTAIYAVSNVIFLLALSVSMGEKLERITKKYGI
ncbi:putative uncharacterized protein [Eubacterium sp. CAG:841]|nr:putative uncharacterized protein [Eubacterium sp. CAG:841]